jgi:hypothetical protein
MVFIWQVPPLNAYQSRSAMAPRTYPNSSHTSPLSPPGPPRPRPSPTNHQSPIWPAAPIRIFYHWHWQAPLTTLLEPYEGGGGGVRRELGREDAPTGPGWLAPNLREDGSAQPKMMKKVVVCYTTKNPFKILSGIDQPGPQSM